jgi:hypothetical protein
MNSNGPPFGMRPPRAGSAPWQIWLNRPMPAAGCCRRAARRGGVLAVGAPATEAARGRWNENRRRVSNPPGKVGAGETH